MSQNDHYLLGEQFQRLHGMTVDQALTGHWLTPDRELMPPEAHEEFWKPVLKQRYTPWSEQVHASTVERNDPSGLLKDWAMNHKTFLVGADTPKIASKVRDFTDLMHTAGSYNTGPLYRGSILSPQAEVAINPDSPLSFTEDRHAATSFKAQYGKRGSIFRLAPQAARGLRLEDFGVNIRTVGQGRRKESEFLVDPSSIRPAG